MKIEIIKDYQGASLLSKISGILFGVFLTSLIFLFSIKLLEEIGLYLGLVLTILIAILGFRYTKKRTTLRMITWGLSITLTLGIISYIAGLIILSYAFEGWGEF